MQLAFCENIISMDPIVQPCKRIIHFTSCASEGVESVMILGPSRGETSNCKIFPLVFTLLHHPLPSTHIV